MRMYLIKQVSEISGVSVRTLHHYDSIGLLSPKKDENGYRHYSEEDLTYLQTILYYKYLGFSLKEIESLLQQNEETLIQHLQKQLILMKNEKEKLLTLIDTLEKTIMSTERKIGMKIEDKFKGFSVSDNENYKNEAIEKYGEEVIKEAEEKQNGKEDIVAEGFNRIFFAYASNIEKGIPATDSVNVTLAKELHEHMCQYAFDCTIDVFSSIGFGYAKNEEFRTNLDKYGKGVGQYACDAIQQYVAQVRGY